MSRFTSGAAIAEPVFVLRPEPGLGATMAAARALGLDAVAAPLFAVAPVAWEIPQNGLYDAVLLGSANALRHGGAALAKLTHLPVIAVGEATAAMARDHGFTVVQTGAGGLQATLDQLAGASRRLLRLMGEAHVPLVPPAGIAISEVVVYQTVPLALDPSAVTRLKRGGVALLHSGEAAARFAAECDRCDIARGNIAIAALAPRIGERAGPGWRDVRIARGMTDGEVLEVARELCQKP